MDDRIGRDVEQVVTGHHQVVWRVRVGGDCVGRAMNGPRLLNPYRSADHGNCRKYLRPLSLCDSTLSLYGINARAFHGVPYERTVEGACLDPGK